MFYVVDGKKGKEYGLTDDFYFSQDGSHYVYRVFQNGRWFVVMNGIEGKPFDKVALYDFSADNQTYVASEGNKAFLMIGGEEQNPYDHIAKPTTSADRKRVAYPAERNGEQYLVVDGQEFGPYNGVGNPVFSPEGRRFAWIGNGMHPIIDGTELKEYQVYQPPNFSLDGQSYAFIAHASGKEFVVWNGRALKKYNYVESRLYWSLDGKVLAYVAHFKDFSNGVVVVNENEGNVFDVIGDDVTFSNDNRWLRYSALEKGKLNKVFVEQKIKGKN